MQCIRCGIDMPEVAEVCPHCGTPVTFERRQQVLADAQREQERRAVFLTAAPISFREAFRQALHNAFRFEGRARRKEFWALVLVLFFVSIVVGYVDAVARRDGIFGEIFRVATLIPLMAAGFRRMHDIGRSGAWIFFPLVNLVLACFDTVPGVNRYGEDSKYKQAAQEPEIV